MKIPWRSHQPSSSIASGAVGRQPPSSDRRRRRRLPSGAGGWPCCCCWRQHCSHCCPVISVCHRWAISELPAPAEARSRLGRVLRGISGSPRPLNKGVTRMMRVGDSVTNIQPSNPHKSPETLWGCWVPACSGAPCPAVTTGDHITGKENLRNNLWASRRAWTVATGSGWSASAIGAKEFLTRRRFVRYSTARPHNLCPVVLQQERMQSNVIGHCSS